MATVVLAEPVSHVLFSNTNIAVKLTVFIGALLCLTGVAIGAFGAHALADVLAFNQRQATFELANRYQFYHGLALLIIGLNPQFCSCKQLFYSTLCLGVGVVIFSASLYVLAVTNVHWLGAVTPIGGISLLVGWTIYLIGVVRDK